MAGIDLEVVGQRQQLVVDAVVELRGVLARVARRSGRPTAPTNSVSPVSTNHGSGPRLQIGHDQADALGRVAGRVQHPDARVAELDLLAVVERLERERHVGRLVQAVRGAGPSGERRAAGA